MKRSTFYTERILAVIAAIILLQTLYFKFTGHPDSVYIFTEMGVEPYGRIGLGIIELNTAALLMIPRTSHIGALSGIMIMTGAVFSHLLVLGVVVNNDGGTLFLLALTVFICCLIVAFIKRKRIISILKKER